MIGCEKAFLVKIVFVFSMSGKQETSPQSENGKADVMEAVINPIGPIGPIGLLACHYPRSQGAKSGTGT